jgi:dTDP-glucose pyrophosphorylase
MIWKKGLLYRKSSIYDAIKNLEETALQIVLITDIKKNFIGTLTDGDIRLGILKGAKLNSPIEKLINKNPILVNKRISKDDAIKIMKRHSINHLPIVKNKKVVGLYQAGIKNDFLDFENLFVIMAGGKGKRLMPLTKYTPKPLLIYKKKHLIEHILYKIKESGFSNVYISVNYLKDKIINKLKNGTKYDLKINYLKENQALGTAGSLAQLKNKTKLPILVSNCDVITDMNYLKLLDFHIKKKADVTVVIKEHQSINPFGQIKIKDSKILDIIEKPISLSYINAGIYVLNPKILNYIKKNQRLDMSGLIAKLLQTKKKIIPYPITDKWSDVSEYLKKYN